MTIPLRFTMIENEIHAMNGRIFLDWFICE